MAVIVGVWELGWNTPIKEVELWEYPLRDYGIEDFYMTPVSGIRSDYVQEVSDLQSKLQELRASGHQVVFVDERGDEELSAFTHPERAAYVFGKASFSPLIAYKQPGDKSVAIKTKHNLATLWPHQAATLVLHDRYRKES